MSAVSALQIAIVDRLKANAGVTALIGQKVYDRQAPTGPSAPAPPFLIVASSTEVPWATLEPGWSDTFTLVAWVPGVAGTVQAAAIIAAATAALRSSPLTVDGYSVIVKRPEMNESLPGEGGRDARAARYRVIAAAEAA